MSPVSRKRKVKKKKKNPQQVGKKETIKYVCLNCKIEENIPADVVEQFDIMDDGDTSVPPRFSCESCGGEMYPEDYQGIHGEHYKLDES